METSKLKKFAQYARRSLIEQVSSKLVQVLKQESPARRELPQVVAKLEAELKSKGQEQLIEQVAYIWFNRFCALRFMDVNGYNRIGVLSPVHGQFQPEILAEAKAGHIDEAVVHGRVKEKIVGLFNGTVKSHDGQAEAYRLLIVAVCNDYHRIMPYLFGRIEDYSELLMPDDLLSGNSILASIREAMTPAACESVESIGWLYQFYISEKKDQVFESLKKNKKITPDNIPAATQLFTPHWIVRYLVENSLGRLWMLNNPNSKVIEQMQYYIKPVEQESDFLKISSPEDIKICDPACGSGHMLTYAYDLLYAIYLEAGYDPVDIPELILTKNLYGIEIDERAAELAAFALSMKAIKGNPLDESNNRRRFFRNPIKPNICRLEKVSFEEQELNDYIEYVGKDLFTQDLRVTLTEFEEADNFGSLIQPTLKNAEDVLAVLEAKDVSGQLFLTETHERVLKVLKQTDYLSQKYHVVVANPPYMGGKGMNARLAKWVKDNYPDSKSDLFAMFIERDLALTIKRGFSSMINMQSWMFLSSFEKLRNKIIGLSTITSMIHLGTRAFDSIGGEVVSTTAYVLENNYNTEFKGRYIRLVDGKSEAEKKKALQEAIQNPSCGWFHRASAEDFKKIPGVPIAYWASEAQLKLFNNTPISQYGKVGVGLQTGNNDKYIRHWFEVSFFTANLRAYDPSLAYSWFKCNKGGEFRKWFGNGLDVIFWKDNGSVLKENTPSAVIRNESSYFQSCVTWSRITSGKLSFRYVSDGFVHNDASCFVVGDNETITFNLLAYLNSPLKKIVLEDINPTLNLLPGQVNNTPYLTCLIDNVERLIEIAKYDWDSCEISWDFSCSPLLQHEYFQLKLADIYQNLCVRYREITAEMQKLEEKNNYNFIRAYGLQGELAPEVPIQKITLTCNPAYRYGIKNGDEANELRLRADTLSEFLSYAVGCMFGRYSLNKEGLILANQGDTLEEYLKQVPNPSFMPDDDNVIPMIDFEGDWFEDDISERFKQFLKVTFGEEHFIENLAFVEEAIGKDINKYFVKDFYADHVKRYKKRPIYWLFSSPKGTFNALIYMHRYRPDTVSVVLNDYLREFRTKLQARKESYEQVGISASASQKEKTQAIKAIGKIDKALEEVNDYERDILYPLAGQNIEIDLDDGVKQNYPLFGKALKKIAGLSK